MRHATAYENYGRFVVDCPNPQDSNAWEVPRGSGGGSVGGPPIPR